MEIDFANNRIRKLCSSLQEMRRNLGDVRARNLATRLDQLEAVSNLEKLRNAAGDWHELTQNRKGQIAANIGHPYRLILIPTEEPPPTKPDGGLDWTQINEGTISVIVNYH
jgi:proteic killer suppression protein